MKLPFSRSLNAFRFAPRGRRFKVVWKLWSDLARSWPSVTGECVDIGEFRSFEEFEIKYATLAILLERAGKTPPPGELDFLHAMVDRDDVRYPGGIGARDFFFLTALVSILAPRRVIEIGTLTGFSAAIIAAAIHRQHGKSGEKISVETIDLSAQCIIDETRPTGFEIPELIPDLAFTVRVHTGRKSDFVRELAAGSEFGLAFIDADHRHPWPLLDVLRLAPYVQNAGWIVLHDIQLGTDGKKLKEADQSLDETPYGAEWLFDRWPFRKIRSAHIGAIELPARKADLIPFSLSLMEEPFEIAGGAAKRARRALYGSLVELA